MNNTKAKKLFTVVGFGITNQWFGARIEDQGGSVCAEVKQSILGAVTPVPDTYTLEVAPGANGAVMVAIILCLDKMREREGAGGGH